MEMKMMNRELLLKGMTKLRKILVHNDSKITKSDLRKFIKVIKQPLDPNAKVNWMYGLKHELEHFTPPRFLVVGNNPYGRTHLINMIKRNILHKVDVASNITEALRQFKSVANKG